MKINQKSHRIINTKFRVVVIWGARQDAFEQKHKGNLKNIREYSHSQPECWVHCSLIQVYMFFYE